MGNTVLAKKAAADLQVYVFVPLLARPRLAGNTNMVS